MLHDDYGNSRFYGIYRGIVADNNDTTGNGKLKLRVPQVFSDAVTDWAWPMSPSAVKLASPSIGQGVWVMFEGGDPSFPIWVGVFGESKSDSAPVVITELPKGTTAPTLVTTATPSGGLEFDLVKTLIAMANKLG